jgi:hypothetical protein
MNLDYAYKILISAINEAIDDQELTADEAFDYVMDKGIVVSANIPNNTYILASVETFLKYYEANGNASNWDVIASVETYLKLTEAAGGQGPERQSKSFVPSVEKILDIVPNDAQIIDKGIVESVEGEYSALRILLGEIQSSNWAVRSNMSVQEITEILANKIFDKGIVFLPLFGVEVCIASVETALKYLEQRGMSIPL